MTHLCASPDLAEGQSRGFELEAGNMLAVRKDGQVHVYENRCPHRGVSLQWLPDQFLDTSGSLIQCATHGALFLIDSGECVAGPCAGQALQPVRVVERDGMIWLQND